MANLYAPADFQDAEQGQPLNLYFDMTGTGIPNAYSLIVDNVITKAVDEMKQKTVSQLPTGWKKKLRDFMVNKHQAILDCIEMSLGSHPVLSKLEILHQKFACTNFFPNASSVKTILLDISGSDVIAEINAELLSISKESSLQTHVEQTKYLFDKYREMGEAIMEREQKIKNKMETFNRLNTKLSCLFEIESNDKYEAVMKSVEEYLKHIYEINKFDEDYHNLLEAYRRFISLRDIIQMGRTRDIIEKEPVCGICIQESVMYAIVPCGHTFCQTCSRRQMGTCYMCRSTIKEKVKLFFG
jgi:hypothetical protein